MSEAPAPQRFEEAPDAALFDKVVNLCKRRGFVFPSAEIYGGFRSTYDYGPVGPRSPTHPNLRYPARRVDRFRLWTCSPVGT